jgi:hypothetical protein
MIPVQCTFVQDLTLSCGGLGLLSELLVHCKQYGPRPSAARDSGGNSSCRARHPRQSLLTTAPLRKNLEDCVEAVVGLWVVAVAGYIAEDLEDVLKANNAIFVEI